MERVFVLGLVTGFGQFGLRVGGGPGCLRLPLFVDYFVLGVYGEDVGFVDVVRRSVGVEGADAELVFGWSGSRW